MALNLEQKRAIVAEVAEVAARAHSLIASELRGLKVADIDRLRVKARQNAVHLRAVKNTLARRALVDTPFAGMGEHLRGPLIFAFSMDDPGAGARLLREFGKQNDKLVVKIVSVGGLVLDASAIDRLASLPTREQALSTLMAVLKAPIERLARTLAEPHAKLVRTLAAIRDQKQAA